MTESGDAWRPKALLLDLDNTLIDRDGAFERWARAHFEGEEVEEVRALDGHGLVSREEFCSALSRRWPQWGEPEEVWRAFRAGLLKAVEPDVRIARAVELLGQHYELAVVSNGGVETQRAKMERAGLQFEHVLLSEEIGAAKPSPQVFRAALARLGVEADEALMVGDDVARDLEGASAAGIASAWVSGGADLESMGCRLPRKTRYVVETFDELPQALGIRSSTPPSKTS